MTGLWQRIRRPKATQTIRLVELLQDRMAALSGTALAAGVELELLADAPVRVRGRRDELVSLIDNLVDNAIKYNPRGATVSVCLEAPAQDALLLVRDRGRGIPAALRERVFDRFYRAPDQTETGSGLGLAIARSVVQQHGGTIALCDAADGPGLLVRVALSRLAPCAQGDDRTDDVSRPPDWRDRLVSAHPV